VSIALTGGLVARSLEGPVAREHLVVSDGRIGGARDDAEGGAGSAGPQVEGGAGSAGPQNERVDVSGCLVVPGNSCAHHHLYSALARGMPGPVKAPRNFLEILQSVWWRLDRALDSQSIRLSALAGAVSAAGAGTTSLIDHHASPGAIEGSLDMLADALEQAGMRGVVCYEVTDRHGEEMGRRGIEENVRFLGSNDRPTVRGMMGAHASFTIGPATMDALVGTARSAGVPVHIHLAEDGYDQEHSLDTYGVPVTRRLADAGALGEGDLVAHGVWLSDDEVAFIRSSGAWLAHNPRSNMNNGVGYAPALEMGERVALGTDGIDGDMFAEVGACYLKARERSLQVAPKDAVRRLAAGAAVTGSLFGEPALGTLEPGAPADLVVLEYRSPTPIDDRNLAGHYVFGVGPWAVRDVMVAGRWVIRDRMHQLVDETELAARCGEEARRLWTRMETL
jgi:putative selenium metabolism protein SsnA